MLLFGHTGITLCLALGWDKGLSRRIPFLQTEKSQRLTTVASEIDYRLVLLGSMLPDMIDKPVGVYLFGGTFDNGRIFCHTLLSLLIVLSIGLYRYRRYAGTGMLALAFGYGMHLILDEIWNAPSTLFWPLLGASFPDSDLGDYVGLIWDNLTTKPSAYVPEIIGLIILIPVALRLLRSRRVMSFLKSGVIK